MKGSGILKLTHRVGDVVYIGEDIRLMVSRIHGKQVELAYLAPPEVRILRHEVRERERLAEAKPLGAP